jgi:ABC-type branched-subunit amino acid transport system permease subunit
MVHSALNCIYGFTDIHLGQWGFFGIGAYTAADITYAGLLKATAGLIVGGMVVSGASC